MNQLQALTQHILTHTRLERENIQALADNGVLIVSGQDIGLGYEVARFKYDAVISLERFAGSATDITAIVAGWLIDHDTDRDALQLADPEINATLNDDETADVEIVVEFNESIQVVADDNGPITAWGQRWRVNTVDIDTAEALVNMEGGTDD